ncbi:MAG: SH3 domain-containing protein [Alphaproteobacteria bacterium]|nr:SH3 domain-containing protein [Alphaproteobacteria bacterium]
MRNLVKTATFAIAGLLFATSGIAAEGVATGAVNVRTGPGSGYSKVDTLHAGEQVEIGQCQAGWCYVEHDGPDGWVSANYLQPGPGSGGSGGAGDDCTFNWVIGQGFTVECGGNSVTVPGPGGWPPAPAPTPMVCIYDGPNYSGAELCGPAGSSSSNILGFWNDRISSIKVSGGAKIKLCQNPNYLGFCNTFSSNLPQLGVWLDNKASSYQTW